MDTSTTRPRRSAAAKPRAPAQALFEEGSDGEPFDGDDDGDGDFALAPGEIEEGFDARQLGPSAWAQAVNASASQPPYMTGNAVDALVGLTSLGRAPSDVAIHPGLCVRVSAELADMSSEFAGVDLAQHQLLSAYASAQAANPTAESLGIPTQLGNDFVEADFGDEDDRPKSKRKRADGDLSNDQRKKGVEAKRRKNINDNIDRIKALLPSHLLPSTGSVNKADILGHAAATIVELRNRQSQHVATCDEYRRELAMLASEAESLRAELSILRA